MLTLQNPHYQLSINPQQPSWSLFGTSLSGPSLEDVQMSVQYRQGDRSVRSLQSGQPLLGGGVQELSSPHGPLHALTLKSPADETGLRFTVIFALPDDHPLMLWKLIIDHRGSQPVQVDRIEMLKAGFIYTPKISPVNVLFGIRTTRKFPHGSIRPNSNPGDIAFYSNGWQSWSYTGMLDQHMHHPRTRFGPLRLPVEIGSGGPQTKRRGHFGSDMFGMLVDRKFRTGILAGFLSQTQQFGSLEALISPLSPALMMWANGDGARLDPGASMETDWACIQFLKLDEAEPAAPYLDAAARENGVLRAQGRVYNGWCSWYHFYNRVTAGDIQRNLQSMVELRERAPMSLVQIDDGFETKAGDWYSFKPSFPNGLEPLADEIRKQGFTPGLWLAPFVALRDSQVVRQHPEWVLRGWAGLPVNPGYVLDTFPQALDLTVPAALEYAAGICRTAAKEWGFPYLKIDFLYAAALLGRFHDPTRTRAQVLRRGLEAIREAVGNETYLVGCGCPLGPALGLVDAMRVGPDVEQRWVPVHFNISLPFKGEPGFPSAWNAVRNTLSRAPLHRRLWVNDPDCLLLRPSTYLTLAEIQSMASVTAMTGGPLLLSDDLAEVPDDRLEILQALLPVIGKTPYLPDFFDVRVPSKLRLDLEGAAGSWSLVALFNWKNNPSDLNLRLEDFGFAPGAACLGRSFWDGQVFEVHGSHTFRGIPAHGTILLALRKQIPGDAQFLGSNLHVSQGLEVSQWAARPDGISLQLVRPAKSAGVIDLKLPRAPVSAELDGKPLEWQDLGLGIFRFPVTFDRTASLNILYQD
jgi:alpha-galactosidase